MYKLAKKDNQSYDIIIQDRTVGTTHYKAGKWLAEIGELTITRPSRKRAVESLLTEIIFTQLGR